MSQLGGNRRKQFGGSFGGWLLLGKKSMHNRGHIPTAITALCIISAVHAGCTIGPVTCLDDTDHVALSKTDVNAGGDSLSLAYCAQLCADRKMPVAGAEYGTECYCGRGINPGARALPSTACNVPCASKNSTEKCGGTWKISVFNVSCSGPPEPRPDPAPSPPVTPYLNNPCRNATSPFSKMPWCDPTLSVEARVEDMISRMSLPEKIAALDTAGPGIASLGLDPYNWWSEATHGISHVRNRVQDGTRYESNFAFPITTAMSFNRSLWEATGRRIGIEARAFMNQGDAWSTYWAPVINLAREPRWGRNIETPGEDPYLSGEYATAFVRGLERNPIDPGHLQASACCKHYVANSMDNSQVAGTHWDRNHFDANITMRDLVDSYLPPFQA